MIELPDHLVRRIRTAATVLLELSKDVPYAPTTVFGLVASISGGAPEAEFQPENVTIVAFAAGELEGIAVGLDVQLPVLLIKAGIEPGLAADKEARDHAFAMDGLASGPNGAPKCG